MSSSLFLLGGILSALGGGGVVLYWKNRFGIRENVKTVVDVFDEYDAVRFIKLIASNSTNGDTLADRVFRLLERFPPSEQQMQQMSMSQQRLQGLGNEAEFCITIVFSIAMLVVGKQGFRKEVEQTQEGF